MTDRALPAALEVQRDGNIISTDPARLDLDVIHGELSRSYWASGRPREVVARSLQHSLCFGLYHDEAQVGLASSACSPVRATALHGCSTARGRPPGH